MEEGQLARRSHGPELRDVVLACVQDGPGRYNEEAWQALDRVLEEARRAGLKVILSFLDNWKYLRCGALCPATCPAPGSLPAVRSPLSTAIIARTWSEFAERGQLPASELSAVSARWPR